MRWMCKRCDASEVGAAPLKCPQCGCTLLVETDTPQPTQLGARANTHVIRAVFKS